MITEIPANTRAISVRQPWAHAIAYAGKRIENRTWGTAYRGPLLIHASLSYEEDAWDEVEEIAGMAIPDTLDCGGILAIADLVDVVTESDDPWFVGPYGLVLANVRATRFVECKGRLGLWRPDARLLASLR